MRSYVKALGVVAAVAVLALAATSTVRANVYVSNVDGDTVSVINPASNTVVTTISVGNEPRNLAATPNGSRVYVPNRFDDNVSVIATASNTVIATVNHASFDEPYAVAVTPNGGEAWVVNKQDSTGSGSVTIITTASNTVATSISDACFSSPEGIVMHPTQPLAYVVNRGTSSDGSVCVVNTGTRSVVDSIDVGGEPRYAVITPSGSFVYVSRVSGGGVAKIDTSDNTFIEIATAGSPRNMAITPTGDRVYVATQGSGVDVIDSADNVSTITLTGASSTYGVALHAFGGGLRGYVTDENNEQVFVFDVATDTEITGSGFPISDLGFSTPRAIASAVAVAVSIPVPTLSEWLMMAMALLIAGTAAVQLRRGPRRT